MKRIQAFADSLTDYQRREFWEVFFAHNERANWTWLVVSLGMFVLGLVVGG